jgi:hypothetical protein
VLSSKSQSLTSRLSLLQSASGVSSFCYIYEGFFGGTYTLLFQLCSYIISSLSKGNNELLLDNSSLVVARFEGLAAASHLVE